MNPFLVMRTALKLTQVDLGTRAQVTDQYIRRLESGTVSNPSGAVIREIYQEARAKPGAEDKLRETITKSILRLRQMTSRYTYTGVNPQAPNAYKNLTAFNTLVVDWWDFYLLSHRSSLTTEDFDSVDSVYGLCRLLLLHPYTVQRWDKVRATRPDADMPIDAVRALVHAQISHEAFNAALDRIARLSEAKKVSR